MGGETFIGYFVILTVNRLSHSQLSVRNTGRNFRNWGLCFPCTWVAGSGSLCVPGLLESTIGGSGRPKKNGWKETPIDDVRCRGTLATYHANECIHITDKRETIRMSQKKINISLDGQKITGSIAEGREIVLIGWS